eukprot:SAG22_NODE_1533_length_4203_cov_2.397904_2_plen_92_part_00
MTEFGIATDASAEQRKKAAPPIDFFVTASGIATDTSDEQPSKPRLEGTVVDPRVRVRDRHGRQRRLASGGSVVDLRDREFGIVTDASDEQS